MQVIAHRGFSSQYNENTLEAFHQALVLDIHAIELDVHQVEREFIVFHDPYVNKLTGQHGRLCDMSLSDVSHLLVRNSDPIPTLQEVAALVGAKAILNIEIKALQNAQAFVAYIQSIVQRYQCKIVLSSFDHPLLQRCIALLNSLEEQNNTQYMHASAALIAHLPVDLAAYATKMKVDIAAIDYQCVNAEFVKDAHARGLQVWCYTVNYQPSLEDLLKMGVDAIFTDNPLWAIGTIAQLKGQSEQEGLI